MLTFASPPKAGRELQLALKQLTLRGSAALLAMPVPEKPAKSGRTSIETVDCVFDLAEPQTSLFLFRSRFHSSGWLKQIKMTSKGSLAKPGLLIAQWTHPETGKITVIETTIEVRGFPVSIGTYEFTDPGFSMNPAGSALKSWRVARVALHPPGIDASLLRFIRNARIPQREVNAE